MNGTHHSAALPLLLGTDMLVAKCVAIRYQMNIAEKMVQIVSDGFESTVSHQVQPL